MDASGEIASSVPARSSATSRIGRVLEVRYGHATTTVHVVDNGAQSSVLIPRSFSGLARFLISLVGISHTVIAQSQPVRRYWHHNPSCLLCSRSSSPRATASRVCSVSGGKIVELNIISTSGLAFHPTQPLLAASLHNGSVQLWNYRMGVLVDRFEEHEGMSRRQLAFTKVSFITYYIEAPSAASQFIRADHSWRPEATTTKSKSGVRVLDYPGDMCTNAS